MPRTRRIALLAALAVVGALGLTACGREQPGTAAYVDDVRFTDRQLDTMVAEAAEHHLSGVADVRRAALSWLVLTPIARQAARERGISPLGPDYAGIADRFGMPVSSHFVRAAAEYEAAIVALQDHVQLVPPTQDLLRRYYDDGVRAGVPLEDDFETWSADAGSLPSMPILLAIDATLRDAARHVHVVISPRYLPLYINIGPLPVVLGFPSSDVVRSSPTPGPSAGQGEEEPVN